MDYKKAKLQAVVISVVLLATAFMIPAGLGGQIETNATPLYDGDLLGNSESLPPMLLDRNYVIEDPEASSLYKGTYDDAGTRRDAGDIISRSTVIYPGEPEDIFSGRLRSGMFYSTVDDQDWYTFSACEGQQISFTVTPPVDYDIRIALHDDDDNMVAESDSAGVGGVESFIATATMTGEWYVLIEAVEEGTPEGEYTFEIELIGQNDADTGDDAGDDFASATPLSEGEYSGYLDMNDEQDWYVLDMNQGEGINLTLEMRKFAYYSDFDLSLYNPSGELVHYEGYYYDDSLVYPADVSGEWRVKVDIYPGYTDVPEPTGWEYFTYGSGAYILTFAKDSSATMPYDPIPQPEITPIAKSYIIENDPLSNNDEFGYLASIPAANYLEGGERYLAGIFYEGDDTSTNYYETGLDHGDVDDTTQYLIDDWNDYLALSGKTAEIYDVPADPIEAAAEIATDNWDSSDIAVIAVNGGDTANAVKTVVSKSASITHESEVLEFDSTDPEVNGPLGGFAEFIAPKWGAMLVEVYGFASVTSEDGSLLDKVFPNYINLGSDWYPTPYDGVGGDALDIYYPVTTMGLYVSGCAEDNDSWTTLKTTKIAGDRYHFRVANSDQAIYAKIETSSPSDLLVFLVDPDGNIRAPDMPEWNGPVNDIHEWNGYEGEADDWRMWEPDPHTEFSTYVTQPNKGYWTAIVVPRHAQSGTEDYDITIEIQTVTDDREGAVMGASNGAVIGSLEHAPLLYVMPDEVPAATQAALNDLGVSEVILMNLNGVADGVKGDLNVRDELTTVDEIVDYIKAYEASENYITFTSLKTGGGWFAPSAMLAAYHGSPVLRVSECNDAASAADRIETWRLWAGDYYHGSRSPSHLPDYDEPLGSTSNLGLMFGLVKYALGMGDLPPFGLDAKRYWNEEVHDGIYDYINDLGLDLDGQEAYCFVADRKDITLICHSVMMGNNSYAGHIPGLTPAYSSAIIVRDLLYPAIIYANENRDIVTTQLMNYPDGGTWRTNDGVNHNVYSSREIKYSFSSHMRIYEGHILWEAHLERMNEGASVMYYSGHGTGGSGISAQPYEIEHANYPEQIWYDAWRGYDYDTWGTPRDNGRVWYNSHGDMVYDIIHYDWVDELTGNLRSNAIFYMSCSTADGHGPMVYLDHGALLWYGNAGSGLCPEADLQDDEFFYDVMIEGESVGQAFSHQVWLHYRDFTTDDPTSMYGGSSMTPVTTVQCIYGDPSLIVYSPEWTMPVPVDA